MKKTLLLLLLAASGLSMSAQRRLVLIEEFTNDGCSPCASYSPTLDAVLDDRIGEVIAVKYHVGFPDNEDDVYTSQKANMDARINYYGINSVPTTVINGYKLESTPNVTSLNNMINVCASDGDDECDHRLHGQRWTAERHCPRKTRRGHRWRQPPVVRGGH